MMLALAPLLPGRLLTCAFGDASGRVRCYLPTFGRGASFARAIFMKDRNSKSDITLQPPVGFRTSGPDGVITLSDGTPLKPDPQGFYCLDRAHAHLLRTLIGRGWHAPRAEMRTPRYAREVGSAAYGDMIDTAAILKLANLRCKISAFSPTISRLSRE